MKTAFISDMHGNAQAMSAVINDIEENSVDSIICLGDVATLGPSPREVLAMIRSLDCPCIIGNHEEALFDPENAADYDLKGELLANTLYWCLDQLKPEDMAFLKKFATTVSVELPRERTMLCYHGSPLSSVDSIDSNTPDEQLEHYFDFRKPISVAVGGHTHVQMLRQYRDSLIINPGSIGCAFRVPSLAPPAPSFSPIAEYAIIDIKGDNIFVDFKRISYNLKEFISTVNDSDLPLKAWWNDEFKSLGIC